MAGGMAAPSGAGVYLLHFDCRINPAHPCRHYIGYARNIPARVEAHRAGSGSRLAAVARQRGIGFVLARQWDGAGRDTERRLKRQKNAPRLCPICNPKAAAPVEVAT